MISAFCPATTHGQQQEQQPVRINHHDGEERRGIWERERQSKEEGGLEGGTSLEGPLREGGGGREWGGRGRQRCKVRTPVSGGRFGHHDGERGRSPVSGIEPREGEGPATPCGDHDGMMPCLSERNRGIPEVHCFSGAQNGLILNNYWFDIEQSRR